MQLGVQIENTHKNELPHIKHKFTNEGEGDMGEILYLFLWHLAPFNIHSLIILVFYFIQWVLYYWTNTVTIKFPFNYTN